MKQPFAQYPTRAARYASRMSFARFRFLVGMAITAAGGAILLVNAYRYLATLG
jgi:hypothetical protein